MDTPLFLTAMELDFSILSKIFSVSLFCFSVSEAEGASLGSNMNGTKAFSGWKVSFLLAFRYSIDGTGGERELGAAPGKREGKHGAGFGNKCIASLIKQYSPKLFFVYNEKYFEKVFTF